MITVKPLASSSLGNAYLLESGGRRLLLECGITFKSLRQKLNYQVASLDGCLISHSHGDHSLSIHHLMRAGVDIYCTHQTFKGCGATNSHHRFIPTGLQYPFQIGEQWKVIAFETVHDCPGSVGFQIVDPEGDRLVFLTDTGYCRFTFSGMNILMVEANFSEAILRRNVEAGLLDKSRAKRIRENHFSIERVIDLLKANKELNRLREVRLLHLSSGNSDAAMFKRMVQEIVGIPVYIEEE